MADVHSMHMSGFGNPYVQIQDARFLTNADGHTVKRTKAKPTVHPIVRFLEKIRVSETRFYEGAPCWEWIGCKSKTSGYGQFKSDGRRGAKKSSPHRFAYEYFIGDIPDGMEPDHLCQNRSCGNPLHLEAVTHAENLRRRAERMTHCKNGHPRKGVGACKECNRERVKKFHQNHDGYNAQQCSRRYDKFRVRTKPKDSP